MTDSRVIRKLRIIRNIEVCVVPVVVPVFEPIGTTGIRPAAEFPSSALKTHGVVLDAAEGGQLVRIRRRRAPFILVREDRLVALMAEAADTRPKTLDDLVRDFTPHDAEELRARMAPWLEDEPAGAELL